MLAHILFPAVYFYPRPPRGGRRWRKRALPLPTGYFYPRPPRGGRRGAAPAGLQGGRISTHALREEGDTRTVRLSRNIFQISTHALREEGDRTRRLLLGKQEISTHALREEGDGVTSCTPESNWYFYPRPPRGGRR